MTDLKGRILALAKEYREFGWNVIPLADYSKSPSSSPFIKKNGWKMLEGRTLTDQEFDDAFDIPNLTGIGFITGAISRTIVIDEDSYKQGGVLVDFESPMVSQTASGGRHIFGKYISPVKTVGLHKGINVEAKADGGFIVLPPSQVYKKGPDGKLSQEIGEYKWLSQCRWEQLPIIAEKDLAPYKPKQSLNGFANGHSKVILTDYTNVSLGEQHNALRTFANAMFNEFSQDRWDYAEKIIREEAAKYKPAHPQWRVEKLIKDCQQFVLDHPKENFAQKMKESVEKDNNVEYKDLPEEEMREIEKREIITTGLSKLDDLLEHRTGFYLICGNPGSGKGWYATWLAKQFYLLHHKKTVLFSLEMAEPQVRTRLFQQWSHLTEEQFETGDYSPAIKLMKAGAISVYPFGQTDAAYQTPENFASDVDQLYEQGYRVFMFDHFHELDGANSDIGTNQKVAQTWGKTFQEICKKYPDIWLFVFAQPNGEAAKKHVLQRTDVSGSKSMTQKCEVFISLNRKLVKVDAGIEEALVTDQDRSVLIYVDKNRLSSKQKVGTLVYLSRTGNFTEFPDEDVMTRKELELN